MDMIPRNDYGERCQFDAYCKLVLYHEAIDYLREMQRRRDRELSFSDLPQMEMDKLCVVDYYPSDRFTFSSHGYDLHIENELVADAFAGLSVQEEQKTLQTPKKGLQRCFLASQRGFEPPTPRLGVGTGYWPHARFVPKSCYFVA